MSTTKSGEAVDMEAPTVIDADRMADAIRLMDTYIFEQAKRVQHTPTVGDAEADAPPC